MEEAVRMVLRLLEKQRREPYPAHRFRVEIDGLTVAQFSEVGGLQLETEVEQYEEGGVNDFVHQLPKRTKYQHIVLKRGITDDDYLWKWHQDVISGRIKRRNGMIALMDREGREKWRWAFLRAYPVKWSGPDLKADMTGLAFESVEFVHEGIRRG
jgi:phage tail-like protein